MPGESGGLPSSSSAAGLTRQLTKRPKSHHTFSFQISIPRTSPRWDGHRGVLAGPRSQLVRRGQGTLMRQGEGQSAHDTHGFRLPFS